jgi:hypothetical protein
MTTTQSIAAHLVSRTHLISGWSHRRLGRRDRGDVPGWVLITIMTAGLVTVLWALAGTQLQALFSEAMSSVTGPR